MKTSNLWPLFFNVIDLCHCFPVLPILALPEQHVVPIVTVEVFQGQIKSLPTIQCMRRTWGEEGGEEGGEGGWIGGEGERRRGGRGRGERERGGLESSLHLISSYYLLCVPIVAKSGNSHPRSSSRNGRSGASGD